MLQYNITVYGKVQGVWFRKYTQIKAQELHICGIVKNQSNGTVYIEAVGNQHNLTDFIQWLKTKGSPLSEITNVTYTAIQPKQHYTEFDIIT
ncbi:MAG: acylphosphatase [Flavobacteriaceae bacterium]